MNAIIEKFIKDQQSFLDNQIRNAFREHFGFPLEDVKDPENIEHCVIEGDPTEFFRYRGQTFLLWQKGELKIDPYQKDPTGIIEHKFLAI